MDARNACAAPGYDASLKLLAAMWSLRWMDAPSTILRFLDGARAYDDEARARVGPCELAQRACTRATSSGRSSVRTARERRDASAHAGLCERQSALPCEQHASNAMPAPMRAHASGRAHCHANSTQAARCQRPCGPSAPWRASHTQLRRRRGLRLDAAVSGAVVFQGSGPRSGAQLPGVAPQADIGRLTRLWTGALTGSSHGLSIVTLRV
jgi:hypothetical protein